MRRKILCAVLSLLMVVSMLPIVAGAADNPTITFEQQTTAAGASEVKVDVKITNNPGFVSATIPVKWDASVMTLSSITLSTAVVDTGWCGMTMEEYATNGTQGLYYLAWNNDTRTEAEGGNFTADGTLCTMAFNVKDTTKDTSSDITADLTATIANMMTFDMADLRDSGLTATTTKVNLTAADAGTEEPDPEPSDEPTVYIEDIEALVGSTVKVKVLTKNNPGFTTFKLKFTVPEQFKVSKIEEGSVVAGSTFTPTPIGTDGYYPNNFDILVAGSDEFSGDGCVAEITLDVPEDIKVDEYTIELSVVDGYDNGYNEVTFSSVAGKINVYDYVKGDVSGDGKVNGLDVVVLSRYVVGGYTLPDTFNIKACNISKEAGIDNNDTINGLDVVILSRYVVGGYGITFD